MPAEREGVSPPLTPGPVFPHQPISFQKLDQRLHVLLTAAAPPSAETVCERIGYTFETTPTLKLGFSSPMAMAARKHNNLAIFHADVVGPLSEYDAASALAKHLDLVFLLLRLLDGYFAVVLLQKLLVPAVATGMTHPHFLEEIFSELSMTLAETR